MNMTLGTDGKGHNFGGSIQAAVLAAELELAQDYVSRKTVLVVQASLT